jgi:hypothetical protein
VAIGLFAIYFVLSLLASTLNEVIAAWAGRRARFLEHWLGNLLRDPKQVDEVFYNNPLLKALAKPPRIKRGHDRRPGYVATEVFSSIVLGTQTITTTAEDISAVIARIPEGDLKNAVTRLQEAGDDLEKLRVKLERWYDNQMERVSGWYKRRTQLWLALIGIAFAIILNADTLQIVRTLWSDKTVRAAVVAEADKLGDLNQASDLPTVANEVSAIKSLNVPLGWTFGKSKPVPIKRMQNGKQVTVATVTTADPRRLPHDWGWLYKLIGIAMTALAISLGAPFWFDLLSKVARLRISGAPPPARDSIRTGEGESKRAGTGVQLAGAGAATTVVVEAPPPHGGATATPGPGTPNA